MSHVCRGEAEFEVYRAMQFIPRQRGSLWEAGVNLGMHHGGQMTGILLRGTLGIAGEPPMAGAAAPAEPSDANIVPLRKVSSSGSISPWMRCRGRLETWAPFSRWRYAAAAVHPPAHARCCSPSTNTSLRPPQSARAALLVQMGLDLGTTLIFPGANNVATGAAFGIPMLVQV